MAGGVRQWDSCPGNWAGGVGAHAKSKSDKSVCVCVHIYIHTSFDLRHKETAMRLMSVQFGLKKARQNLWRKKQGFRVEK